MACSLLKALLVRRRPWTLPHPQLERVSQFPIADYICAPEPCAFQGMTKFEMPEVSNCGLIKLLPYRTYTSPQLWLAACSDQA